MIDLETAKTLKPGQTLYHITNRNADGTPQRWRVNGQPKTWKLAKNAHRVRVPLKHGLWSYDYLTETSLDLLYLTEDDALAAAGDDDR